MRLPGTAAIAAAAVFAGMTTIASAQQRNTQQPVGQPVTVAGCLISESDYRKAHGVSAGEFGGAGMQDEFVVVDIAAARPAGTTTCSEKGNGPAYRVTGHREEELKGFVGRWVEITGTHEKETYNASSSSKLPPEIEMTSFREAPAGAMAVEAPAPPPAPAPLPNNPPPIDGRGELNGPPPMDAPARAELPSTASIESLIALVGLLCVIAASGLLLTPRRQA